MRKFWGVVIIIISVAVLGTAMNQSLINRVKQDRYFDHLKINENKNSVYYRTFVRSDRWRYGDLYGLCYLPRYKHLLEPFKQYPGGQHPATGRVLYIIGDSFLADKSLGGAFDDFDDVIFLDRRFPLSDQTLDKAKQNYLLLEFAERNLNNFAFTEDDKQAWDKTSKRQTASTLPTGLFSRLGKILFNEDLNRNLELLLFDDKLFTPLKEAKAQLNYKLFNRVANEVAVSTDEKRLLLNVSVDTSSAQSSFIIRTDKQVNQIKDQLSIAGNYYKSVGFKQVFLGVIPNAVSVYDAHRMPYNHLLERVEKGSALPVISVYNNYKRSNNNLFYISDAHWNPLGLDLWVKTVNDVMRQNFNGPTQQ